MAPEDDCMHDMFVLIRFADRKMGVPLIRLEAIDATPETNEAMDDWRYWVGMGYQF
jgi:hypothetical protein